MKRCKLTVRIILSVLALDCAYSAGAQIADSNEVAGIVKLLQSNSDSDIVAAKNLLTKNPSHFIDVQGVLSPAIIDALISCYERIPSFPPTFEVNKENAEIVARSPKVMFFVLLAECGGDKSDAIIHSAADGDDPILRIVAESQRTLLHQRRQQLVSSRDVSSRSSQTSAEVISISDLSNHVAQVLCTGGVYEKQAAIRVLLSKAEQIHEPGNELARTGLVGLLKDNFNSETNLAVREDILIAIPRIDDAASADEYLQKIADDANLPSFLRNQARQAREALAAGVFR